MNGPQAIRTAARIGGFCARHLAALLVTVVVPCVLWTLAYIALLLWAIFTDSGIGGPFAYPAGLLFCFIAASAASVVLLFPSVALAEWLARRQGFPILAQIPISIAILSLLCLIIVSVIVMVGAPPSFRAASVCFGILLVAHLPPLGLYWWVAQGAPLLLSLCRRLRGIFRP